MHCIDLQYVGCGMHIERGNPMLLLLELLMFPASPTRLFAQTCSAPLLPASHHMRM
jgi:hypothetical protein